MPDRNHFHHKLLRMGLRSQAVMVSILSVAIFFIAINTLLMKEMNITLIFLIDLICWIFLHLCINWKIRRNDVHKQKINSYQKL